uniref:Lipocalin-2 1 n=1 Tax=Amblyomma parvum TaxID=251391 RepID=A0A023G062_AMBPA
MYFLLALAFLVPSVRAISEESKNDDIPTLGEVIDFFNTTEKIWVYTSSEGPERQCLSIKKISGEDNAMKYRFTQEYLDNTGTHTQTLTVRLTAKSSGKPPGMTVTSGRKTTRYTPKKFNVNEQCGIFSFNRPGKKEKQCEVYVWHNTVMRTTPEVCFKEVDVVCEGLKKYQLYSSSCPW